jgi:hypothetical protein
MNVTMWKHCTFDSEIFECGKVDYSDSIIITNFVKLSFPAVVLNIFSLPTLALKSNKISNDIQGVCLIHVLVLRRTSPSYDQFYHL